VKAVGQNTKYVVPGLDRGLRLLSLFNKQEAEFTLTEINRRMQLPYATTYRLLHTLELHGLLHKTKVGFRLGPGILRLGYQYLSSMDLVEIARPVLVQLRDTTRGSANLGVLDGIDVVYIAHVPSTQAIATRLEVGSRMVAHSSSIGRLLLGAMQEENIRRMFKGNNLKRPDGSRHRSIDALIASVRRDEKRGYVLTKGAYHPGIIAVAAPIFDRSGMLIAGLNVSGLASDWEPKFIEGQIKDQVCAAARAVSALLGHQHKVAK
jgi:DNA-binding IclR family transcriptional regulator